MSDTYILLSASGYCFGASYAVNLAATDSLVAGTAIDILRNYSPFRILFSAAFAHPSMLEESHFEKIKGNPSRTNIHDVTIA